jgi:hypothetical protein
MTHATVHPSSQRGRRPCSVPLQDADLGLDNANWTKGVEAMSEWCWAGNLNPVQFPNNLSRFFLQIPGIFEQQLNYSTALIFDEPSFRNGVQVSGFIDRVLREFVISLIARRRRVWYTMTHHAFLGMLTARKHGLSDAQFAGKWLALEDHAEKARLFTRLERAVLAFADAFCTDPKAYGDGQYKELVDALAEENDRRYPAEERWLAQWEAARTAKAIALMEGKPPEQVYQASAAAAEAALANGRLTPDQQAIKCNAQVVELAFLCLQFVALGDVFTSLSVPDEEGLRDVLGKQLPREMLAQLDELNDYPAGEAPPGMPSLLPPPLDPPPPLDAIRERRVVVEPVMKSGKRLRLEPYELHMDRMGRDAGISVGGAQVGVWGWSFGGYFPGGLIYCLMQHPELARFEPPYSLPLLFNENEWRNGVQTGGYTSRKMKELLIQKAYRLTRNRYGLEHHTMYLYNTYLDEYGVGRGPSVDFTDNQRQQARTAALRRAEDAALYVLSHRDAPCGTFSELETAALTWAEETIRTPHTAWRAEPDLRAALRANNEREIAGGLRRLDRSGGIGDQAALDRLENHQVAEMAMMVGHMDGLGRLLCMLQLEAEGAAQIVRGTVDGNLNITAEPDTQGHVQPTGFFNNRPALHPLLRMLGINDAVLTLNELLVNPQVNQTVHRLLADRQQEIRISAEEAAGTAEF